MWWGNTTSVRTEDIGISVFIMVCDAATEINELYFFCLVHNCVISVVRDITEGVE